MEVSARRRRGHGRGRIGIGIRLTLIVAGLLSILAAPVFSNPALLAAGIFFLAGAVVLP